MSNDSIKDEDRITRRDLLQANATLIAGVLIFLGIFASFRSDEISGFYEIFFQIIYYSYLFFLFAVFSFSFSMLFTLQYHQFLIFGKQVDTLCIAKTLLIVGVLLIIVVIAIISMAILLQVIKLYSNIYY
jgi:hypothetical protein